MTTVNISAFSSVSLCFLCTEEEEEEGEEEEEEEISFTFPNVAVNVDISHELYFFNGSVYARVILS